MSTVTILLPTYNRSHFLPYAIESALSQTHHDIRLIILDDASPDDTPEIVQPYLKDARVRYIRHAQNKGITGNWRAGIEILETEFFCLLEDDDVFGPDFVERMLKPLQDDKDLILSFCDHWAIDATGDRDHSLTETMSRRFGRHKIKTGRVADLAEAALITGSVGITAAMFRASHVSPEFIRDEAGGGIDFWLFYQCARTGRKAYYLSDRLMEYRLHGAGMSHSMPELMAKGHLFLYREMLNDSNLEALHVAAHRKFHEIATSYGIHLLMSDRGEEAIEQLTQALRHGSTVRARVACCLAYWGKGRTAVQFLRQSKKQIARNFVPLLQHAALHSGFIRLARHFMHGFFFRHQ